MFLQSEFDGSEIRKRKEKTKEQVCSLTGLMIYLCCTTPSKKKVAVCLYKNIFSFVLS